MRAIFHERLTEILLNDGGEIPSVHDRNEDFLQFTYRIGSSLRSLREVLAFTLSLILYFI